MVQGLRDERLSGVFTAIVTPFTPDGSAIDFARLAEQVAFQAVGGVTGVVIAGTTGESPTLDAAEHAELLDRAVALARAHGLLAVAGTGSNSTAHAVEAQRRASRAGADAALSVVPYYNRPTQEGLYAHFMEVADAAPVGVILYNVPGRCAAGLSADTIERLARHPNIVAVKEATGSLDMASEVALRCPALALLSGDDSLTLPIASVGGVGVVSVLSNLLPQRVSAMCDEFLTGRFAAAREIHREVFPLCRALFAETNPIPVKAAMALLGRDSGALRLPMTPPREETVRSLRGLLGEQVPSA
jgi:4-hydroxy-tetrahydrodipicolinate synthase